MATSHEGGAQHIDGQAAYLGPPGTYSHQVALRHFGADAALTPRTSIAAAFDFLFPSEDLVPAASATKGPKAPRYALLPYENSTYGPVLETLRCLFKPEFADGHARSSDLVAANPALPTGTISLQSDLRISVVGEAQLGVCHALLVGAEAYERLTSSSSGAEKLDGDKDGADQVDWKAITRILSHEQALGQCASFLSTHMPEAKRTPVASTALAAQLAAQADTAQSEADEKNAPASNVSNAAGRSVKDPDAAGVTAALASEICADVYGLKILRRNVQDRNDNTTRFLVVASSSLSTPADAVSRPPCKLGTSDTRRPRQRALLRLFDDPDAVVAGASSAAEPSRATGASVDLLNALLQEVYASRQTERQCPLIRLRKLDRRPTSIADVDLHAGDAAVPSSGRWPSAYVLELEAEMPPAAVIDSGGSSEGDVWKALQVAVQDTVARLLAAVPPQRRSALTLLGTWSVV